MVDVSTVIEIAQFDSVLVISHYSFFIFYFYKKKNILKRAAKTVTEE